MVAAAARTASRVLTRATPVVSASSVVPSTSWVEPVDIAATLAARGITDVNLQLVCDAASEILFALSGRRWRANRSTIRPSRLIDGCNCNVGYPYGSDWGWGGGFGGQFGYGDGYWWRGDGGRNEIILQGPVVAVESVTVDGVALAAGVDWFLYDRRRLVRGNGLLWPCCQNLGLAPSQTGTWQIVYVWGSSPPVAGHMAAVELAVELALALSGKPCKLPTRTTTVAAQGVTAIVQDPLVFLERGFTGLPLVDLFLRSANPAGLSRRAVVRSPDSMMLTDQSS